MDLFHFQKCWEAEVEEDPQTLALFAIESRLIEVSMF